MKTLTKLEFARDVLLGTLKAALDLSLIGGLLAALGWALLGCP